MATPAAILSILVQAHGIAKTSAQLEKLDQSAKRTADSTTNLEKKFSSLDRSVGDFNRTMSAARNTIQLVKFPALIAGAGMATQVVGALAAGAVSLTSALAPLAGAGAAGAAGVVAFGQALGTAKLATMGLEDAIKGQKGAMDKLSPVQRAFVKDIRALKEESQGLRGQAQRGLIPGLDKALKTVTPLMKQLAPIVKDTAEAMGDLAVSGAQVVKSWGADLQTVGKTNVTVIKNLGTAAIAAADGARHLVVAGGPLLVWLSEVAVKGANWVRAQIEAGRESGRLAGFLEKTRDVMGTLGRIAVNLGAALFGIGKAAAPLGRDLLGLFEDLTKKFREWVESATGRNALDDYFRSARQPILEVAGLIGDVGAAFIRLSQPGPESGGMIARLRELVPVLENVVASTTAAFGPVLIDALTNVVRLFGQLAGTSGPLNVFVQLIGVLAGGLADLLASNPALNTMVVSLVGFAGVVKALGLLSVVTGMSALGGVIVGTAAAYRALAAGATVATVAQERGVIATVAARAAILGTTAAVAAWTTAQWALNVALTANPIGLVVVGLAALGAALVVAYVKVGAFRNAVDATFSWIKSNWPTILAILTGPIGLAVLAITKNWATIRNAFSSGVASIIATLRGAVGAVTNAGKALGTGVANGVTSGLRGALNIAHEIAEGVRDAISKALNFGLGLGRKLAEGIKKGVKDALGTSLLDVIGVTGDGIGKAGEGIGKKALETLPIAPVKGGGSLMGARPSLAPFAAIGAANGLHVSSGLRRGSITSSGNVSYHSTGEAVDLAGPAGGMMKTFRTLRSRFGSRLAELIYTPGGAGIKDGKPYVYTGQVAADHRDHVHVAFDTGKPGVGDGIGKRARAALTGDGIGRAISAAKAAGFKGEALVRAVAIAGLESNFDPNVKNLKPPDHSIGLWQINQLAHKGKYGTDKQLTNPTTNAKAAYAISNHGRNWSPWSTNSAVTPALLEQAREAIGKGASAGAGVAGGTGGGGGASDAERTKLEGQIAKNQKQLDTLHKQLRHLPTGSKSKAQRVKLQDKIAALNARNREIRGQIKDLPKGGVADKVSNFEMIQALASTAITQAGATPGLADDILANTQLRDATTFRIKQVRKALKKPNLKPATRLRLTQELGTLIGSHTELQGTLKDLREKPLADALQRSGDLIDTRLGIAQTTESLADDLGPLGDKVRFLTDIYNAQAKKFGASSLEAQKAFLDLSNATKDLAKTQRDAIVQGFQAQLNVSQAALVNAQVLTPGNLGDDLGALQGALNIATQAFEDARVRGDTEAQIEFGGQVLSLRDAIEQLQGSIEENTKQLLDLQTQLTQNAQTALNISQSQYGTLQQAIAEVANRQIGGGVGLGFMTPGFAGGSSRY